MGLSVSSAQTAAIEFVTGLAMSLSYGFMITYLVLYGKAMPEHAFFMLVFVGIFTMLVSLFVAGVMKVWRLSMHSKEEYTQIDRPLNRTYLAFPMPQIIGFLLMINYVLAGFGSPHVPGMLQAILTQGSIPFTILLSYLLLKRKYNWMQLLGAAIVIAGALISLKDDLVSSSSSSKHDDSNTTSPSTDDDTNVTGNGTCDLKVHDSVGARIVWDILYLISTLPIGLVNILMEYFLQYSKGSEVKRNRVGELNIPISIAVNNFWLVIWLFAFFWLNLIPGVVPSCNGMHETISEFGNNLHVSAQCIFNRNGGYVSDKFHKQDDCTHAGLVVTMLAVSATVQMLLQAVTVQQHSATFTMALITLGPIFAVFFQRSRPIMLTDGFYSDVNSNVTAFTWAGLVVVLAGIVIYKIPGFLLAAGTCQRLHPPESDDAQSFLYKMLGRRLLLNQQRVQEEKTTVINPDVQPLLGPGSTRYSSNKGCC